MMFPDNASLRQWAKAMRRINRPSGTVHKHSGESIQAYLLR